MKRHQAQHLIVIALFVLALAAGPRPLAGQIVPAARYEGKWQIQPNGDVHISRQFKLPLNLYRMWKDADVHMLEFRNFEACRSNVEVTDKKAQWDDINRTLTLNMTVLGLAGNMASHWEAKVVPGLEFSNLDQNTKTAYFHFAVDGPMGRVQGQDVVCLPPRSTDPAWNESTRTIRYGMPKSQGEQVGPAEGSSRWLWWTLFTVFVAAGAAMWGASLWGKPKAFWKWGQGKSD